MHDECFLGCSQESRGEVRQLVVQVTQSLGERGALSILNLLRVCLCVPSFLHLCFYSWCNWFDSLCQCRHGLCFDLEHCVFSQSYIDILPEDLPTKLVISNNVRLYS